ncbi:MAG TPA: carbon-nitrogen hydrolase family protein [Casimicrobiaceae bacterium]|nr:carbon-nitrogen hydrolase family protein [Casimicrobiaceae bacterium]
MSYRVAAVQMVSGGDVARNLDDARLWIARAAEAGAQLVVLPEYFGLFGARATDKVGAAERDGDGPQQAFLADAARRHSVHVVGGCVPIATNDERRVRSACIVYGPDGQRVARYDKMHLFAYDDGVERYDEGKTIEPGEALAAVELPFGRVALSICYDIRFPELYRKIGDVALILLPSAFTVPTGRAHWELLLRARAVENQCYVLAAAQGGVHPTGRATYGHSMLVDPWGDVVATHADGPGLVLGDVDPDRIAEVRRKLPAHAHRRFDAEPH